MSPDIVKGYLRGAVLAGLIDGWYRHMPYNGVEWIVNPKNGPCESHDYDSIVVYCRMLMQAEIEPFFPRPALGRTRRYD